MKRQMSAAAGWSLRAIGTAVLTLGLLATSASAAPILSLTSPDDLDNLAVGQEFQIDVTLSGLRTIPEFEFIIVLNSKVLFDAALLDPVSGPTASLGGGSVFQVAPSQIANFNSASSLGDGAATGNFNDAGSSAINSEGLFYSFRLRAEAAGSGTIDFDAASTQFASFYTNFGLAPIGISAPLSYTIRSAVVPEPSTWSLIIYGGLLGGLALGRRRRRAGP
jgi:hypothetical protein